MSEFSERLEWELRNSKAKHDAPAQQEFADVRMHVYFGWSAERREQFKRDMHALAEAAERLSIMGIRVKAEWAHDSLDKDDNCIGSIETAQSPEAWLEVIEL